MKKKHEKNLFKALTNIQSFNELEIEAVNKNEAIEIAGREIYDKVAKTDAIWGNIDVNLNVFESWRTEEEKREFRKAALAFWGIEPQTVWEDGREGYEEGIGAYEVYYGLTKTGSQFVLAKDEEEAIKIVKIETGERMMYLKNFDMTILKVEHDKNMKRKIPEWVAVKQKIERVLNL